MHIIGAVDYALCDTTKPIPGPNGDNCTSRNSRAYSKNGDWPDTTYNFFTDGCYESGINPSQFVTGQVMPGCFRVVDVADPTNPKRIAEAYVYDTVNSPAPPPPQNPFWGTAQDTPPYTSLHYDINVWINPKFNGKNCTIYDGNKLGPDCTATGNLPFQLTFSTQCGDWKKVVDPKDNVLKYAAEAYGPTCWDKGWITRTHFTAGADGFYKLPDYGVGTGHNEFIYWVNTQRQGGASNARPSYTGITFWDLSDWYHPKFLSRIEATVHIDASGNFSNATNIGCDGKGVHHGVFDGRYAYTDWCEYGYTGDILTIVDAQDPKNPKIASQWWVPGQKNDEPRAWKAIQGFQPVTRDVTVTATNPSPTGLLQKDVSLHYPAVYKIKGRAIAFCEWHSAGLVILDVTDRTNPQFLSRFDYLTPDFQATDTLPGAQLDHQVCQETWKNRATWSSQTAPVDAGEAAAGRIACGYAHSGKIIPETNNTIYWVADEYFTVPYGHMRIFDVSDLKNPKLLSHFLLPPKDPNGPLPSTDSTTLKVNNIQVYTQNWAAISENFALGSDYPKRGPSTHLGNSYDSKLLFLAWYGAGVKAIDTSDPTNLKIVGSYPFIIQDKPPAGFTNGSVRQGGAATYDVIFDKKGHLVVTDSNDGVRILEYTGPGSPLNTGPGSPIHKLEGYANGPKK